MFISEFARAAGLPPDTVRFYVKRGLLRPEEGAGGSNPYQVFTKADLEMARLVRQRSRSASPSGKSARLVRNSVRRG